MSQENFNNWEICKEISAWGMALGISKLILKRIKVGNYLIFCAAKKGFLAKVTVDKPMERQTFKDEATWAGGLYRYGANVPFKIDVDHSKLIFTSFVKMIIEGTQINTSRLEKGFSINSAMDGNYLNKRC